MLLVGFFTLALIYLGVLRLPRNAVVAIFATLWDSVCTLLAAPAARNQEPVLPDSGAILNGIACAPVLIPGTRLLERHWQTLD